MTSVEKFLNYLQIEQKQPSLEYLNELVVAHQKRVRWETLTKFIDFEDNEREKLYLPSIDTYIDRVVNQGTGGTCWTLARGFHYLLHSLGFQVDYLYMDPGHLCLQVLLDQPYYVDIGYCAPLYKVYPLHESFKAENDVETFTYEVREDDILVSREPGPTKILGKKTVTMNKMNPHILHSHNWQDGFAFKALKIFGYIDNKPYQLKDNKIIRFTNKNYLEEELSAEGIRYWVEQKFGMDYAIYKQAKEIYDKRKIKS
ncbi:arylamine N-acetyltransferase [Sutcliffiella halmapala]|uniref:arylamine N-acetyltransferase n=1 Tax=Sutcliffiella halmapala TaxID=79882 RepID=UPI0009954734|nr:arylamine N-acetyltransferase [Sutcliffiella halmapala]